MSQTAALTDADAKTSAIAERDDKMPDGVRYIVANEFAERFCFYGINAILSVYMAKHLMIGEADATTFHSLFKFAAYASPFIGAIMADVFWGKYRTIMTFSTVYAIGCSIVALVPGKTGLLLGLSLVALGTGGIKPCVSTNVGDQFTSKNQHLIERAFSLFYLAINAGSSISIFLCPVLLDPADPDAKPRFIADYLVAHNLGGPMLAFGMPAAMMFFATFIFWLGRNKFAVVPPAGKAWWDDIKSPAGLRTIFSLAIIYIFVAVFWALWDQSNGQTWTLQAESSLMDKNLGFGITLLPAQIQVVNGLLILIEVPIFTYLLYPFAGRFFTVTPLRKISTGFFVTALSFVMVGRIEAHIQSGHVVSVWWQILAFAVLTASEVLVSITALEFSYKQAPARMKSFIMACYLFAVAAGNLSTALVNQAMIKPITATAAQAGADTWVTVSDATAFISGQKIDFDGETGLTVAGKDGKRSALKGTFMVAESDPTTNRVKLMDAVDRKPVSTEGTFSAATAKVTTYKLVGPQYFNFFALMMAIAGVIFIPVAARYKGESHVRREDPAT
jgi:POT family proton-dependent oligopeptide transporter